MSYEDGQSSNGKTSSGHDTHDGLDVEDCMVSIKRRGEPPSG